MSVVTGNLKYGSVLSLPALPAEAFSTFMTMCPTI